jgi:hypothetical protein
MEAVAALTFLTSLDYRTEPLRQDNGLANEGGARDFNSLFHAGQCDVM